MPAWGINTRLLYLMAYIGWENFEKWPTAEHDVIEMHMPKFLRWFNKRISYIKETRVQEAMYAYYVLGESRPVKTGYNQSIERGKVALAAMYNCQLDRPSTWSTAETAHEEVL